MGRYINIPILEKEKKDQTRGKQYYGSSKYPQVPLNFEDTYVYTTIGDRLDKLALEYYGRSDYWWIISSANDNLTQGSLFVPEGTQLRIPTNISSIISSYEKLNNL